MTEQLDEQQVRAWLTDYAWLGTPEERAGEVACIMARDGWRYVDVVADQFAGSQEQSGPDAFDEGVQYALSALYECHEGPHLLVCPAWTKQTCAHPEEQVVAFTYGAPGYGGGTWCRACETMLESAGGVLTAADVV